MLWRASSFMQACGGLGPHRLRVATVCSHAPVDAPSAKQRKQSSAADRKFNGYYGDIDFAEVAIGQSSKRVRQHTNPLRRELQVPAPAPVWADIYTNPSFPLVLDVGCGYGRFLIALATQWPNHNMLGLDIRQPLMERGNKWASRVCPGKVFFQYANATVSLDSVLGGYPGELDLVTIQYPDPQFKRRHHKRRMVQPQLVEAIVRMLRVGGRILLQSDVKEVALAMRGEFEAGCRGLLWPSPDVHTEGAVFCEPDDVRAAEHGVSAWAAHGWLNDNPLGLATEREIHSLEQGLQVYRILLVKGEQQDTQGG